MTLTLSIETSCDETAISVIKFKSEYSFTVLSDLVLSQIDIHKEYGGVFPAIAKREHLNNLFPLCMQSLDESDLLKKRKNPITIEKSLKEELQKILDRDEQNLNLLVNFYENFSMPKINLCIATYGPGLEIALWTGFNFTKALALLCQSEFVGANHMEGHIFSALIEEKPQEEEMQLEENFLKHYMVKKISYPSLSLLISGGHTELVLMKKKLSYEIIGKTLDDAVGEAYDKSARLLGISYPGGPQVSKLASSFEQKKWKEETKQEKKKTISLPRPMLTKNNFDFSFSGLKTAVLYSVREREKKIRGDDKNLSKPFKELLCAEFEDAVSEVLLTKTKKAIAQYGAKNLLIGGGVSANRRLRNDFKEIEIKGFVLKKSQDKKVFQIPVHFPNSRYTGDNALMIAVAGYTRWKNRKSKESYTKVDGNLKL